MVKLQVFNPQANTSVAAVSLAPRLSMLEGKTIGLYWNMKAGGDVALEHTAQLLGQRFPGVKFKQYIGDVGACCAMLLPSGLMMLPRNVTPWSALLQIEGPVRRGWSTT
jgi:hypothetical protein